MIVLAVLAASVLLLAIAVLLGRRLRTFHEKILTEDDARRNSAPLTSAILRRGDE